MDADNLSWQVVFFVLGGVALFYSGGTLLYLLFGNPGAGDYKFFNEQRAWVNAIFFTTVAAFPLVIWTYVRDRRKGRHAAMADRVGGMSMTFWGGIIILVSGLAGTLVSYSWVKETGGTYIVFIGLIIWGVITAIRGMIMSFGSS